MTCAFESCPADELAGGPDCCLVGGCVLGRYGAPPPKPPAPVRRRQRPPQERLFGQAVGKARRKRERAGGVP
jgi:hypothetical protein